MAIEYDNITDMMIGKPHEMLSEKEIDEIIDNFNPEYFDPPVVLEHDEEGTAKTFPFNLGKIQKLYKNGKTLWAKVALHDALAEMIRGGLVKGRSLQFFRNYEKTGKAGMRHLSFLGKSPPRIKNMPAVALSEDELKKSYEKIDINGEFATIEFQEKEKTKCTVDGIYLREGKKMPETESVFTLKQHETLVAAAVEKAKSEFAVTLSEREAELNENITTLGETVNEKDTKIAELEKNIATLSDENKKIQIISFLDANQLKFLPAHRGAIEEELMELSDKTRATRMKNITEMPDIISLGEDVKAKEAAPGGKKSEISEDDKAMFNLSDDDIKKYARATNIAMSEGGKS